MNIYLVKRVSDGKYASTYRTISVDWVDIEKANYERDIKRAKELKEYCEEWLGKTDKYIIESYTCTFREIVWTCP
jgi:hypothetical protein